MKVVVLGGGYSGFCFIEALHKKNPEAEIVLVDKAKLPYNKTKLIEWLGAKQDVHYTLISQDFIDSHKLQIVNDVAIRVNFDRKRIFFKNEKSLAYDKIVMCSGHTSVGLDYPGAAKEGVYDFWNSSVFELKSAIRLYQHIVLGVSSAFGLACAVAIINSCKRDFKILLTDVSFLDEKEKIAFIQYCAEKQIEVIDKAFVTEAIGDSRVKAVKLNMGKFLVCDTLIDERMLQADLEYLKDQPEMIDNGLLKVTDSMSIMGVQDAYACGNLVNPYISNMRNFDKTNIFRKSSAEFVAAVIAGEDTKFDIDNYNESLSSERSLSDLLGVELPDVVLEDNNDCVEEELKDGN